MSLASRGSHDPLARIRGRTVSVQKLMEFVWAFVSAMERLRDCRQRYERITSPTTLKIAGKEKKYLRGLLDYVGRQLVSFELDAAMDRMNHVRRSIDRSAPYSELKEELKVLSEAIEDQFARRYCVYVPIAKVEFAKDISKVFPVSLILAFPSIHTDVIEACRCYSLDRNSASVFHSMAILQQGLYALADDLKVEFTEGIELENWKNIIDQIEKEIRSMEAMKKGKEKDAKLKFYSEAAVQFRYFKDAWRNHVAHQREEYDADQAHSVLIHVRDFMKQLATRLHEIPASEPEPQSP